MAIWECLFIWYRLWNRFDKHYQCIKNGIGLSFGLGPSLVISGVKNARFRWSRYIWKLSREMYHHDFWWKKWFYFGFYYFFAINSFGDKFFYFCLQNIWWCEKRDGVFLFFWLSFLWEYIFIEFFFLRVSCDLHRGLRSWMGACFYEIYVNFWDCSQFAFLYTLSMFFKYKNAD